MASIDATLEAMMQLPAEQRLQIAQQLWDSVADATGRSALPISEQQMSEIEQRMAKYRRDPAQGVPWEQALDKLRDR